MKIVWNFIFEAHVEEEKTTTTKFYSAKNDIREVYKDTLVHKATYTFASEGDGFQVHF